MVSFIIQALLIRHEASLIEAEKERIRMTGTITSLERRTKELELENAFTIESNRALLNVRNRPAHPHHYLIGQTQLTMHSLL